MARGALVEAVDDTSPFYPADIYNSADNLRAIATHEETLLQLSGPPEMFSADWFRDGEQSRREFQAESTKLSGLIRQRIAMLSIVD